MPVTKELCGYGDSGSARRAGGDRARTAPEFVRRAAFREPATCADLSMKVGQLPDPLSYHRTATCEALFWCGRTSDF